MKTLDIRFTRRRWLVQAGRALGVAPLAMALGPARALASPKTAKADVAYQYMPKGDQHCGACASFIAGGSPTGAGTCKIVDGVIPQNGWCALFSKRS